MSFSIPQGRGRCHGNQFLVLSTEPVGVAGRMRLVAQPGGLTLGYALRLVELLLLLVRVDGWSGTW